MAYLGDKFKYIFIDADDTLWENESYFRRAEDDFARILSPYADVEGIRATLWRKQEENIPLFGYGSKTYLIGMLDSATELCGGCLPGEVFHALKDLIVNLSFHPFELYDGVRETLDALSSRYKLVVATKGDTIEQISKVNKAGLGGLFLATEVMQYKDGADYLALARKYSLLPEEIVMVGNSVRSDIAPVIQTGGTAVYIPRESTWIHEVAELPDSDRVIQIDKFPELKKLFL